MASDLNQRKRHRILDELFRKEKGYSVVDLVVILQDEYQMRVSERTIKSDIKLFQEEYGVQFDQTLPKDGKAKRYRYADRCFSVMENVLSVEDKKILADLLGRIRDNEIDPNYAFFLSLLEHVVTHETAKDIDLGVVQFSNNALLKGLDEWFRPLLEAISNKQPVRLEYRPYSKEPKEYLVSPYLLKQFNDRWFLVARVGDRPNLSTFAIDRIESITLVQECPYYSADLDEISIRLSSIYGVSRAFDKDAATVDIVLKVSPSRIGYIDTKPISPCQEIEELGDGTGWYRLTLPEMLINKELVSLLLGFGADVEVISPASLRDEISTVAQNVLRLYSMK